VKYNDLLSIYEEHQESFNSVQCLYVLKRLASSINIQSLEDFKQG
jgi:hypothetical protein